ncbi:integrase core domain-containing protein, partial [Streptomyces sp. NPDC004044]
MARLRQIGMRSRECRGVGEDLHAAVAGVEDLADDPDRDRLGQAVQGDGVTDAGAGGGQEGGRDHGLAGPVDPAARDHRVAAPGGVAGEGDHVDGAGQAGHGRPYRRRAVVLPGSGGGLDGRGDRGGIGLGLLLAAGAGALGSEVRQGRWHDDIGGVVGLGLHQLCDQLGVTRSMGAVGTSADNAACESFHASLKRETLQSAHDYGDTDTCRRTVFAWLTRYNTRRRHSANGHLSPNEYEHRHLRCLEVPGQGPNRVALNRKRGSTKWRHPANI